MVDQPGYSRCDRKNKGMHMAKTSVFDIDRVRGKKFGYLNDGIIVDMYQVMHKGGMSGHT